MICFSYGKEISTANYYYVDPEYEKFSQYPYQFGLSYSWLDKGSVLIVLLGGFGYIVMNVVIEILLAN